MRFLLKPRIEIGQLMGYIVEMFKVPSFPTVEFIVFGSQANLLTPQFSAILILIESDEQGITLKEISLTHVYVCFP